MIILGKAIFIYQIKATLGGEIKKIAAAVREASFQTAILHSANVHSWESDGHPALAIALREAGIEVAGCSAVYADDPTYGSSPEEEGKVAAAICKKHGLKIFIFDAEQRFDDRPASNSNAVKLIQTFRANAPGVKAGWCWWPFHHSSDLRIVYHPKEVLWAAMHPGYGDVDFGMPMAYWSWGDDAVAVVRYLNESIRQWRMYTDKPIIPAGRAYIGNGGTPKPAAIVAFEQQARDLDCSGVAWWAMQYALDQVHLPGIWETLSDLWHFGEEVIDPSDSGTNPPADDESQEEDPQEEDLEPETHQTVILKLAKLTSAITQYLNVRSGPGINFGFVEHYYPKDGNVIAQNCTELADGSIWIRIGLRQWIAMKYRDPAGVLQQYAEFIPG